jgi:hypothetical protein
VDALSIIGGAACMIGICGVGMWLMMRIGSHNRSK